MKNAALALAISKFLKYFRNHLERLWVHKSLKTRAGIVPRITFTLFSSFSQFYVLELKKKHKLFCYLVWLCLYLRSFVIILWHVPDSVSCFFHNKFITSHGYCSLCRMADSSQSKQVGLGLLYKINGKELLGAGLKKHVAVTSVR